MNVWEWERRMKSEGGGDFMEIDDNFVEWVNVFFVHVDHDPSYIYANHPVFNDYLKSIGGVILPKGNSFHVHIGINSSAVTGYPIDII